jgi:LacI family transcriptional regulator
LVTMRDVAKRAGVSVATVSRVLNDSGYVNEDTRKTVLAAIEEMNFKPNSVARSLFKKQSKTIGLIVPDINNPFFPQLARAVEDVTSESDFTVFLCNSDGKIDKEIRYFDMLQQKYVDGVLVVSNTLKPEHISHYNFPIIALDRPLDSTIPYVTCNNYEGARKATQHLIECGCVKVAHISGPENIANAKDRLIGYEDAVTEAGLYDKNLIFPAEYQIESAKKAAFKLLTKYPDIDGIFAGNDVMAIGVIKAAELLGYKVPEQLKVVGFDGIEFGDIISPELTTVSQPIYQMGSTAASMLLDLIEGRPVHQKETTFQVELLVKRSTQT